MPRPSKWIVVGALAFALVGCSSPADSPQGEAVLALSAAIVAHDYAAASSHIDLDRAAALLIPDTAHPGVPTSRAAEPDPTFVSAMRLSARSILEEQVRSALSPTSTAPGRPSVFDTRLSARDVKSVLVSGREASVTVSVPHKGGPVDVVLDMVERDGTWRVFGVEGNLPRALGQ